MSRVPPGGRVLVGISLMAMFGVAGAGESLGTLSQIQGFTVVSKGTQYVRAYEGMNLDEGDRLVVLEGGSAIISFADGCRHRLTDIEVLTIGPTSTCASQAAGSYKVDPYRAVSQDPAVAAVAYRQAALGEEGVSAQGQGDAASEDDLSWVVPAAVGLVAVAGAVFETGGNQRGISP